MKVYDSENVSIREVRDGDIPYLAENMRRADADEIRAYNGMTPLEGLKTSIEGCDEVWTACVDGIPCAIFGVASIIYDINGKESLEGGTIWMFGTDDSIKRPRLLRKVSQIVLDGWMSYYKLLTNHIWVGNRKHIRWLKSMGFQFLDDTKILSEQGEEFIQFIKMEDM